MKYLQAWVLALVAALPALAEPPEDGGASLGPFGFQSHSPLQGLRLTLPPRAAASLRAGETEVRANLSWVNVWGLVRHEGVLLDFETLAPVVAVGHGVSEHLQVELELEARYRTGGALDAVVEGFHRLFHIGPHGRDEYPRNSINVRFGKDGEQLLGPADAGIFSKALVGSVQHNVRAQAGAAPAVSWGVTARAELDEQDDLAGTPFDVGVWSVLSRDTRRFSFHLLAGFTVFGRNDFRGVPLRHDMGTAIGVVEWRPKPDRALIVQYLFQEGAARDLGLLSSPSHEILIGYKQRLGKSSIAEVAVVENLVTFDNSPDFGIHAGITYRLP